MKKTNSNGDLLKNKPRKTSIMGTINRVKQLPRNISNVYKLRGQPIKAQPTGILKYARQSILSFTGTLSDLTSKQVVTLDINGKSIKLLETRGRTVRRWASTAFEIDSVVKEDSSVRLNALGIAVKKLMADTGIKTNKVILSVSGFNSINRILQSTTSSVELMNPDAIHNFVNEEMVLTREQLYLSWKVFRPLNGTWQIYVIGILQDELDRQIRSLKQVGIDPHTIELKAVTLSRLANKKNAVIINIEPFSYDVVVVSNSIPTISHTNSWQPDTMDSENKAEQILLALSLAVDFNNTRIPDAMINKNVPLVIMGQLSADTDLINKIRAISDYAIESIEPTIKYPADFLLSQYTTNVGLALRESDQSGSLLNTLNLGLGNRKPSSNNTYDTYESLAINLLPKAYHPWRPSILQWFAVVAVIIAAGMLIPFFNLTSDAMSKTSALNLHYSNLNNMLEQRKLEIKNRDPLAAAVSDYQKIISSGGYFSGDLSKIRDTADKMNVQLLSTTIEGKVINITCEADNTSLQQFATALIDSQRFSKVTLPAGFWVYPLPSSVSIGLESKMGK